MYRLFFFIFSIYEHFKINIKILNLEMSKQYDFLLCTWLLKVKQSERKLRLDTDTKRLKHNENSNLDYIGNSILEVTAIGFISVTIL